MYGKVIEWITDGVRIASYLKSLIIVQYSIKKSHFKLSSATVSRIESTAMHVRQRPIPSN